MSVVSGAVAQSVSRNQRSWFVARAAQLDAARTDNHTPYLGAILSPARQCKDGVHAFGTGAGFGFVVNTDSSTTSGWSFHFLQETVPMTFRYVLTFFQLFLIPQKTQWIPLSVPFLIQDLIINIAGVRNAPRLKGFRKKGVGVV